MVCEISYAQTKQIFCFAASKSTRSQHQCFSKGDPRTASISITWELIRLANYLPCPRPTESENLGMRLSNLCFNTFSRWFWWLLKLRITASDTSGPSDSILPFLFHPVGFLLPSATLGNSTFTLSLSLPIHFLGPSPRLLRSHHLLQTLLSSLKCSLHLIPDHSSHPGSVHSQCSDSSILSRVLSPIPPLPFQSYSLAVPRICLSLSCFCTQHLLPSHPP